MSDELTFDSLMAAVSRLHEATESMPTEPIYLHPADYEDLITGRASHFPAYVPYWAGFPVFPVVVDDGDIARRALGDNDE